MAKNAKPCHIIREIPSETYHLFILYIPGINLRSLGSSHTVVGGENLDDVGGPAVVVETSSEGDGAAGRVDAEVVVRPSLDHVRHLVRGALRVRVGELRSEGKFVEYSANFRN